MTDVSQMNDKELLEIAAKAMGLEPHVDYDEEGGLEFHGADEWGTYIDHWNPLVCADERWLMIEKLQMGIDFNSLVVWGWVGGERVSAAWGGLIGSDEAHAVLRVAAEIGKRKVGK